MGTWAVSCGACGHGWTLLGTWSEYERQAAESRPCPSCGAYTLRGGPADKGKPKKERFAARRKLAGVRAG